VNIRKKPSRSTVGRTCTTGVEPPAELLVERLRAVDVGNAERDDIELDVECTFSRAVIVCSPS
jgi:hypothetical protein